MIPSGFQNRSLIAPPPAPMPNLILRINRPRELHTHLGGVAVGSIVYSQLWGYAWYLGGGGWRTANRGRKKLDRTARGVEDGRSSTR